MTYTPARRKLTADEYQEMGKAGILGEDERVELLDGELYLMPPIGDEHIGDVISLDFIFNQRLEGRALVSVQNPIRLSDYSEPEPDLVLLRPRADFYRTAKPRPADIFLLVEVAASSFDYDRQTKLPRYATDGIVEVWIVNLFEAQIEVFREPFGEEYALHTIYQRGETLSPAAFPDITILVEEIIG